ncbi:MAG TPA: glycosyltransferase family 4 protein, partial [Longimicrobiales bacterium]|nr:glycosyltransferase family 4 protein [Longimicrobiales bacterium]
EVRGASPSGEWAPYHRWVADGLRAADVVVAPTRYQSELLARHYGRAADRVIHNGMAVVGGERLRASRRGSVLTVGRAWDEAKGVGVLEETLSGLGPDAPSAHLAGALVGPRGERFRPRRLYAHGRLPGGAMGRLYDNAAVYVAASLYEPFGLAPLEAAMHGCALLLTAIGSFRELWSGAAAFVPAGDPVVLGERLLELLEDRSRLDGLAAAARARALDRYTVAHMTTRYRDLYREMREGTGAPAGGGAALESPTRNEEEEG